jgi:predicted nucleic acid-binding protein
MDENDARLIVDTNIWLERLLGQKRADEVTRLLNTVPGCDLATSEFAFYSIGHILVAREQLFGFRRFVTDLFVDGNVSIVRLAGKDFYDVLGAIEQYHLDFDDAYQYVAATSRELRLVSFDTDFDRTDIERLEPADVLDRSG